MDLVRSFDESTPPELQDKDEDIQRTHKSQLPQSDHQREHRTQFWPIGTVHSQHVV